MTDAPALAARAAPNRPSVRTRDAQRAVEPSRRPAPRAGRRRRGGRRSSSAASSAATSSRSTPLVTAAGEAQCGEASSATSAARLNCAAAQTDQVDGRGKRLGGERQRVARVKRHAALGEDLARQVDVGQRPVEHDADAAQRHARARVALQRADAPHEIAQLLLAIPADEIRLGV